MKGKTNQLLDNKDAEPMYALYKDKQHPFVVLFTDVVQKVKMCYSDKNRVCTPAAVRIVKALFSSAGFTKGGQFTGS